MLLNKKIIITGGTGFIGQSIAKHFGKENDIIILGRQVKDHQNNSYNRKLLQPSNGYRITYLNWDGRTVESSWASAIEGADIVLNLAGRSVNCRYHKKQKREILDSRINATRTIGEAIAHSVTPPKLWINAASATIYRHSPKIPQDEFTGEISDLKKDNMPYSVPDRLRAYKNKLIVRILHGRNSAGYRDPELDFSILVCRQWEKIFFEQRTPFTRKVALRTAITLGKGGVITPYLNLCKFGLGGRHGNGKQMFSWVHIEDVCRMIDWLWENKELEGVFNCAAPNPVTNREVMQTLRKITGHRIGLPAPAFLLELGAWLIGSETELMLKSRNVISTRAQQLGFRFKYDSIERAFAEIISQLPRSAFHLFWYINFRTRITNNNISQVRKHL